MHFFKRMICSNSVTVIVLLILTVCWGGIEIVSGKDTALDAIVTNGEEWSSIRMCVLDKSNQSVSMTVLGDQLKLEINLTGTTYSALMPRQCYFENTYISYQKISFVTDSCPHKLPDAIGNVMTRVSKRVYTMAFKSFSFTQTPTASVDIVCQFTLCIDNNEQELCNKSCWGKGDRKNLEGPSQSDRTSNNNYNVNMKNADTITQMINLIIIDKSYSIPTQESSAISTDDSTDPAVLYVMYGLTAFLLFLLLILLFGVITLLCCNSAIPIRPNVVQSMVSQSTSRSTSTPLSPGYSFQRPSIFLRTIRIPRVRSIQNRRPDIISAFDKGSQVWSVEPLQCNASAGSTASTTMSDETVIPAHPFIRL